MAPQTADTPEFRVVVLSGPSGSGKTTVVSRLLAESPVPLLKAISATTRPRRVNERDGHDYYFLTPEEFDRRRERGEFLECAEVHRSGYWYGTLRSEVERARAAARWCLLEIDVQGAMNVLTHYPDAVTVFLSTPTDGAYEQRLRARGTEPEEVIQRRLRTAREELQSAHRYRHRVVNDDLDRAVREITGILASYRGETHANA